MRVERYAGDGTDWDRFLEGREGATHAHLYAWRRVIERVHGHDCPYLFARDPEGRIAGVLPLVHVASPLFGRYLVSMPFLNYGGVLGEPEAVAALVERAVSMAADEGAGLLELRNRDEAPVELPASHRKITVVLDLPEGDAEPLWKGLESKVRSQVRRPRKEGIEMRFGADQVEPFFHVFSRHMRDLGTPTQPLELFEAISEELGERAWFGCAWHGDEPVACGCGVRFGDEFEMTWASALREYSRMAPNMLLYWSFMERCVDEGLTRFNFGRCTPGSGTHRFKKQWGGRDETLWWYQHAADGRDATPSPDDPAWSWAPAVWSRLPLAVSNALGPRIVRYLP